MTAEELLLQIHNGSTEWKSWLIIDAMEKYAAMKIEEHKNQCKHRWARTTKNYKSIKKCIHCGEIK